MDNGVQRVDSTFCEGQRNVMRPLSSVFSVQCLQKKKKEKKKQINIGA